MAARKAQGAYRSNLEYLSDGLRYLQDLARRRLLSQRLDLLRSGSDDDDWDRRAVDQLVGSRTGSEAELSRLLKQAGSAAERGRRRFTRRTQATLAAGRVDLPLEELAALHGLCEFEKGVLLTVLGPSLDHQFKRWLAALNGSRGVEVCTVLELLCESMEEKITARRYFVHSGRLLANGLLNLAFSNNMETESEFQSMDLELPRRVSSLILAEHDIDDQIISFSSVVDPEVDLSQVVLPTDRQQEVLQLVTRRKEFLRCRKEWGFDEILSYGKGTVMLFAGPPGTGKTMLAHALAKETGYRLMLVDLRKVLNHGRRDLEENLQRVFQEARLQHAIVFFDEADELFMDRMANGAMPTILREWEKLDGVCILATNRRMVLDEALERRILYKLDFDIPTPELREEIWRRHLPPSAPLADDVDVHILGEEFEFSGGYIKNAVLMAMHRAMQRPAENRRITQEDLRYGAAVQRRNRLEAHTDKVVPKVTLDDVVLPPKVMSRVRDLVAAARQRSTVFSTWGFGRKLSIGKALTALFCGDSGVGKTMTAEAIASELGQNLYPVRLAAVLSKYVGETEQRLARIFDAAREAQALLFFDEADALFAARVEGGSHHAHYINQQINVLLAEIEKFDGVCILATNRAAAFDPAFERRIRYRVQFPAPDAAGREAIWRGMVPEDAPVGPDVDFAALARDHAFSGGTIKNVVLRAAFAAATDGRVITQQLLRQAAEQETPLTPQKVVGFGRMA